MKYKTPILIISILLILACSLPSTPPPNPNNQESEIRDAVAGTQTALALAAPPNATPVPNLDAATATPAIVHLTTPGEPPSYYESWIIDRDSSSTAP